MEPLDQSALDDILARLKPDDLPEDVTALFIDVPSDTAHTAETEPTPEADGIWTRQEGETATAYAAFCTYRDLGPRRSLAKAYGHQKGTKRAQQASGHWKRWYRTKNWKNRAEAYDAHLDEKKRQAEVEKWRRRGEDLVEEQYRLAQAMLSKAHQMLQFPLASQTVEKKDEKGNPVAVTIEPARWNFNSAARLGKVAVEMARLAAGLPATSSQSIQYEIDPSQLTDDQIERILAGEHPAVVLAAGPRGDQAQG